MPSWNGDLSGWRNYKRQVTVWRECATTEAGRQGPRLLSRLTGEAWNACELAPIEELKAGGPEWLLQWLEDKLEVDEIHLVGKAIEEFTFGTRRLPNR